MNATSYEVHFGRAEKGRVEIREGSPPPLPAATDWGPTPTRAARLVALAHRIDGLVRSGEFRDLAQVAAAAGLTRARVSQIADLALLAPDIQEELLFMERAERGREAVGEKKLRALVREVSWARQRVLWTALKGR